MENIKDKNKKRTRASLFQSSEDGKQEIFLCGLIMAKNKRFSIAIQSMSWYVNFLNDFHTVFCHKNM